MNIDWDVIKQRIATPGPDGKLLPAITGNESDEELRKLVQAFVQNCPVQQQHHHCPFCTLGGLSHVAIDNLTAEMKRDTMLFLFELERECRNQRRAVGG